MSQSSKKNGTALVALAFIYRRQRSLCSKVDNIFNFLSENIFKNNDF